MSSFQQPCPSCNASLELPEEANGRAAICPACDAQFIATPQISPQIAPVDGEASMVGMGGPGESGVQSISIETILGDSQSVYANRRRPLVLPFLIPFFVTVFAIVLPVVNFSSIAITNRWGLAAVIGLMVIVGLTLIAYVVWFALNLAVRLCDAPDQEGHEFAWDPGSWFVPGPKEFASVGICVCVATLALVVTLGLAGVVIDRAGGAGPVEVRIAVWAGATLITLALITFGLMRLWPVLPLVMTGRPLTRAFARSLAMTGQNLMTSFLLSAGMMFVVGFATGLYGVGLMFAIPLVALTLVVGQRLIEGQGISGVEAGSGFEEADAGKTLDVP